uniref:Uncharacterized protein n=1 Tax=Anopheles dirus TaxID=7168 RepID=A0A182NX67_9DIPT
MAAQRLTARVTVSIVCVYRCLVPTRLETGSGSSIVSTVARRTAMVN